MAGGERLAGSRLEGIFGRDLELIGELPRGVDVTLLELAGEAGVEPELSTEDAFMIWWPMASPRGLDLSLLPFTGAASGTRESSKSIYLVKNNKCSVKTESYVLISPKELLLFPS